MKITYAIEGMKIEAGADGAKTITGLIAPFGKVGSTSAGRVMFEPMAFAGLEAENVTLLVEHDPTRPIGRMSSYDVTPGGVTATFRVVDTTAGRDELINAAEGLRAGLSVGANIKSWENKDGVMAVSAADLVEVSLVTNPAFSDARVSEVAASESDATTEAEETAEAPTENEEQVSETATTVETPVAEPVVEAAARPVATTTVTPRVSASDLTLAVIRAAKGDHSAQQLITAALDGATTITSPGVVPVAYLNDVISIINADRPFINSLRRAPLSPSGMSFKKPRWTQYPTVDEHTEGNEIDSSPAIIENITVDVVARMGGNKFSIELFDRSEPGYFDELRAKLAAAYAINTDTAALEAFIDNADTVSGSDNYTKLVAAAAKLRTNIKKRANRLLVSVDAWEDLMNTLDTNDRPLFAPLNPMNAVGTLDQSAGSILGMNVVVDENAASGTCVVYSDQSATYYEMAGSPAFLQAIQVGAAEIEVAVKGYDALALDYQFTTEAGSPPVETTTNLGAVAVSLS